MGFGWALFATSTSRSHCRREHPAPCYGPSSAFLPPSTVCSPPGLAGLFHPAAAFRVPSPQGFAPLRGAVSSHPRPMPSCRCGLHLCGCPRQDACCRLQGVAPRAESGDFGRRLGRPQLRAPLGIHPPPGTPSPRRGSLRRLRPRPWTQRTRCVRPSAFCRHGARLACVQAADPHEVSGLNSTEPCAVAPFRVFAWAARRGSAFAPASSSRNQPLVQRPPGEVPQLLVLRSHFAVSHSLGRVVFPHRGAPDRSAQPSPPLRVRPSARVLPSSG
jgi:hypothetical protein